MFNVQCSLQLYLLLVAHLVLRGGECCGSFSQSDNAECWQTQCRALFWGGEIWKVIFTILKRKTLTQRKHKTILSNIIDGCICLRILFSKKLADAVAHLVDMTRHFYLYLYLHLYLPSYCACLPKKKVNAECSGSFTGYDNVGAATDIPLPLLMSWAALILCCSTCWLWWWWWWWWLR